MNDAQKRDLVWSTIDHYLAHPFGMSNGECSYQAGCAIGRLIPDEELRRKLDNFGSTDWEDICCRNCDTSEAALRALASAIDGYDPDSPSDNEFLQNLQRLHDSWALSYQASPQGDKLGVLVTRLPIVYDKSINQWAEEKIRELDAAKSPT